MAGRNFSQMSLIIFAKDLLLSILSAEGVCNSEVSAR